MILGQTGDDMIIKSVKVEEKIKIERIFSVFEANFPNKFNFSGESHNFWECVYIANGSACVSADCRVYNLSEGEIIFHKPLEMHKFFIDSKLGAKLYIFSFAATGELTEKISDLVCPASSYQKQILELLFSYLNHENEKFSQINGIDNDIYTRLFRLVKNPVTAQMVSSYICQLILSVSQNNTQSTPITEYDTEIFKNAVEIMNDNLNTAISVSQLSQLLNTSESTLKRIFKKYADVSIHRYFLMMKIQKAIHLLENGVSVFEASERLGFSSQAYFSVCFKRETGKNPSEIHH